MNTQSTRHTQIQYEPDQQSDDLDQMQDNSFEGGNRIYQLKSQIHSLQIEKNKLSLQHQAALASIQTKNQQLAQQISTLKRQNTRLGSQVRKLEIQNQQQRKLIDTYKTQLDSINRRTADFHRSLDDHSLGDPTELINQMLAKDKKIEELSKKIEGLEMRPNSSVGSSLVSKFGEGEKEKYEQEIKGFKATIDQLKKKEIAYKREYEGMIQAKEQIIKKMSNQNDEFSRKITESKDKIISELRKQHEDMEKKLESAKNQANTLSEKLGASQRQITKVKNQYRRKEESLMNHFQSEKEDITKGLNEKLKKHLKDKQQKLNKGQQKTLQLQNQIQIMKQQLAKQKAQVVSLNQYNSYLETSNKEYEQAKKKLQSSLYDKERQIGELRQSSFTEIAELKKTLIQERAQIEQKIGTLEQELITKNITIEKYEHEIYEIGRKEQEGVQQVQVNSQREIEKLKREKEELTRDLESLEERYKQKSDRMNNMEKKIRGEFMERITGLETELLKQREKSKEQQQKRDSNPPPPVVIEHKPSTNNNNSEQLQKYINISELRKLQIEQKQQQIRKLTQQKNKSQRQLSNFKNENLTLQKKVKQKIEDYKNLQISFDQLSDKYRKGVKQLQIKIQQMQEQIVEQRKKAQRRKNEAAQNQKQLSTQLKQYKTKVKQMQEELGEYRNRKVEQAQHTDLKLQKLAHEISIINKEKQSAIKNQERRTKEKEDLLEDQKKKLLEYIEQLEDNNDILNKKIVVLEGKEKKNGNQMEKQLRELKIQYSQSLKEVNLILQKYKKLQEVHRETVFNIQILKQQKETLNKKYLQIYKQKNKIFDQLNSSYDQINKLNLVLMSKQQQLHRTKPANCPHYETRSRVYTTTTQQQQQQQVETPMFSGSMVPSRSKSPLKFYDRGGDSFYTGGQQQQQSQSNVRYSRYP